MRSSGNGNGTASTSHGGFEIVEVEGRKFMPLDQAVAGFETAEQALSKVKEETKTLQAELATLRTSLAGVSPVKTIRSGQYY